MTIDIFYIFLTNHSSNPECHHPRTLICRLSCRRLHPVRRQQVRGVLPGPPRKRHLLLELLHQRFLVVWLKYRAGFYINNTAGSIILLPLSLMEPNSTFDCSPSKQIVIGFHPWVTSTWSQRFNILYSKHLVGNMFELQRWLGRVSYQYVGFWVPLFTKAAN